MADEGPTTVGSIDAKLGIDKSEWDRKAVEAKAEAAELGALNPTVRVDANVGAAIAELGAAAAATDELRAREQEELVARGQASNALIDESIQRRHAAAAERYEADQIAWNNSNLRQQVEARNAARQAAADSAGATEAAAAATDNDTSSTDRNVASNQRRITGIQTLIALSPLILAATAPIGSAAIGLGTAFGVMAGAGVLAVMGIKNAMAQGTVTGEAYATGLSGLKINLDQLGQTAANRMLSSFGSVVGDVNAKMPFLNAMVGDVSAALGAMGATALGGVITGLQVATPLIDAGTTALGGFVSWLSAMPSSNGFSAFISYAVANLPAVMGLIESLVTAAGHILQAFAPLGPVVIGFLNFLTDCLNNLPVPVLAGLVTVAASLGVVFTVARTAITLFAVATGVAADEVTVFGMAMDMAVPVIGILLAAISGLAIAGTTAALSTGQATSAVQDYTQALKEDNDQIGANVRAVAAKALVDDGAAAAAQRHGIALQTLLDASLGVPSAIDQVKTATQQLGNVTLSTAGHTTAASKQNLTDIGLLQGAVGQQGAAIDATRTKQEQMNGLLGNTAPAGAQTTAIAQLAAQYGVSATAYQNAVTAQAGVADQLAATTVQMQLQNDAAGLLKQALDAANGKALSAADAQNAFDSALVNMGDHMTATGKKVHFTTTSINDQSAASVALRGQLNTQIHAMQGVVEANGGMSHTTGAARDQLVKMRQEVIDNAVAHGVDRDAVTKYIDALFHIPAKIPPTQLQIDDAAARASIASYQAAVNALRGKVVWITTNYKSIYSEEHVSTGQGGSGGQTRSSGGLIYRAAGGPVTDYLAGGGFPGHPVGSDTVPAWLTPGEMVIRRASAESIGQPALKYMNDTGKLPQSGPQMVTVNMVLDGQVIDSKIVNLSTLAVQAGFQQANNDAGRRPSR